MLPSDEKLTQVSGARLKSPGEPGAAPAHFVNCGWLEASDHVEPPLVETTFVIPFAPPSFQRSCWKLATRCAGFDGSAATYGSTSEPG
jgi:hypothetical protein